MRKSMWVILPDAQIMLVDNVGPHPRPRPLKKKMQEKKLYYEDFP